jgi:hypothetical protein
MDTLRISTQIENADKTMKTKRGIAFVIKNGKNNHSYTFIETSSRSAESVYFSMNKKQKE